MKMHNSLLVVVLLVLVLSNLSWSRASEQPNIMVFLVDDMGVMDTSVPFLTDETGAPKRFSLE